MRLRLLLLTLVVISLAVFTVSAQELSAVADLKDRNGATVGRATFAQNLPGGGVWIEVTVRGLTPGVHGIHVHAVGTCTGDFTSAAGHFNPEAARHGFLADSGPHAGDLPNLIARSDGTARYVTANYRIMLGPGPNSVFDADGSALVIHASPDDYVTDPAGNSGARVVCSVIARGR